MKYYENRECVTCRRVGYWWIHCPHCDNMNKISLELTGLPLLFRQQNKSDEKPAAQQED